MIVAGFGLRTTATRDSLEAALALTAARFAAKVTDLAVVADKADLPAIRNLAAATGLPLHAVALPSVAEAAALAVAGAGGILIQTRLISPDGLATVAIAEGTGL